MTDHLGTADAGFDELLAEWTLGLLSSDQVPTLAVTALQHGCEAMEVALLAGMDRPLRADIDDELTSLLRRLRRARPSTDESIKLLVDVTARRISDGSVVPVVGADRIWMLSERLDRPDLVWSQIRPFLGLASQWEDDEPRRPLYDANIVKVAMGLLERGGLELEPE